MKLTRLMLSAIAIPLCFLFGCSDSDDGYTEVDGLAPTITLNIEDGTSTIITDFKYDFIIPATIADNDGLRSVRLVCDDLYLDKTIDLTSGDIVYSYDLEYTFKALEARLPVIQDYYALTITATDLGGRTTEIAVTISTLGDFEAPEFEVDFSVKTYVLYDEGDTQTEHALEFALTDNKGMESISIVVTDSDDAVFWSDAVTFADADKVKTYSYSNTITFPAEVKNYNLTVTVVDLWENELVGESILAVSDIADFDYMYLADVNTVSALNSDVYGVPMLIDHTGEFEYTARYYNATAGTEIRFIPQKANFDVCFGLDPSDDNVIIKGGSVSAVNPIVLPNIGYYEITLNVLTGEYAVSTYTPTDDVFPDGATWYADGEGSESYTVHLCLGGFFGWDYPVSSQGLVLTKSADNPYMFTAEMTLTVGQNINFTITPTHPWGNWWLQPFWRFSDDANILLDANVLNGGSNTATTVTTAGTYVFTFDTHLLRSKIVPKN